MDEINENEYELLNPRRLKTIGAFIILLIIITVAILIIVSFSSLEATEYGLDYSWISQTISPTTMTNGLHYLGLSHSFIKFPRTVQTIEFSSSDTANRQVLQSRTSDGLEVKLEISFQYTLQPENLYKLYMKYGEHYSHVIENVAIDVLTQQTTKYDAYNFFSEIGKIKDDFQKTLDVELSTTCFSNVQFLQLIKNVDLPDLFEEAIQESEVKKQEIEKATAELNKVKVEVDTLIKSAIIQKDVTINLAKGEAESIIKQNDANIASFSQTQTSLTDAYSKLKNTLKMTNEELIKFIKAKLINSSRTNMIINITSPDLITSVN